MGGGGRHPPCSRTGAFMAREAYWIGTSGGVTGAAGGA
jgi:hypothetical protein